MTSSRTVAIFSPGLDQARAIGRLLGQADHAPSLKGVLMPGEAKPLLRHPFDEIIALGDVDPPELPGFIPTGSQATAFLLERGDVRLGEVTMSQEALCFYDKNWSIDAALAAGVPAPETWKTVADIEAFPVFFKSATEGGGQRGIAYSLEDIPADSSDLIFQEYIDSPGTYGVAIVAAEGTLRAKHTHYEVESYPKFGGSAIVIERIVDERLHNYAERLIRHTRFSGWGLVEFKYCPRRDDYVFMEVNAKFWASSEFAFRNEPQLAHLLFGAVPVEGPCRRMIFMHRAFQRGPGFLMKLPKIIQDGELRFVPGAWQGPAMQLFLPDKAAGLLRKMRNQ